MGSMRTSSVRFAALAAGLALVGGCDGGGGGGDGGGPSGGLALEDVPASSAAILCDTVFGCLGTFGSFFGTPASCLGAYEQGILNGPYQLWQSAIAAGTAAYDAEAAERCAEATSATGCGIAMAGTPEECADVWTGSRMLGETCSIDQECASGAYCNDANCREGRAGICTARVMGGGACTETNECQIGLACERDVCVVPTGNSGGACTEQGDCPLDEQCVGATMTVSGVCTDRASLMTAMLGEPCQLQGDDVVLCVAGASCAVTGFMLPMSATFECLAPVASGASCNAAIPEMCPEGQYCAGAAPLMLMFDGTCTPLPGVGEDCAMGLLGTRCAAGLACVDSRCVQPQANGGPCAMDAECYSGICAGGACVAPQLCTL